MTPLMYTDPEDKLLNNPKGRLKLFLALGRMKTLTEKVNPPLAKHIGAVMYIMAECWSEHDRWTE